MPYERWLGQRGELIAEELLLRLGAELRCRNYRCPQGEIDLVVDHEDDLVAVEVKTRSTLDLEAPEEAVSWRKLRRIAHALLAYAAEPIDDHLLERHWRIDMIAIEIELDGSVKRCEHIRDIYPV
jgi:putative endonuclease